MDGLFSSFSTTKRMTKEDMLEAAREFTLIVYQAAVTSRLQNERAARGRSDTSFASERGLQVRFGIAD